MQFPVFVLTEVQMRLYRFYTSFATFLLDGFALLPPGLYIVLNLVATSIRSGSCFESDQEIDIIHKFQCFRSLYAHVSTPRS